MAAKTNGVLVESFTSGVVGADTMRAKGPFGVSVLGAGAGTVLLQRSLDAGTTWCTVKSYTAATEENGLENAPDAIYRWNCSVYGSGTIPAEMRRG